MNLYRPDLKRLRFLRWFDFRCWRLGMIAYILNRVTAHAERHQKDSCVQARHYDGCRTRIARPAPFPPKFDRDEERVEWNDQSAEDWAPAVVQGSWNLTNS